MSEKVKVKRAGFTIDESGKQGNLPFWRDEWQMATSTSWLGRLSSARSQVMAIAQKRHEQNEVVRTARTTRTTPLLPENEVRLRTARHEQRQLAAIRNAAQEMAAEIYQKRIDFEAQSFDFVSGGAVSAMLRAEMRSALRQMGDPERERALRRFEFRNACLEAPAELSNIPQTLHARLKAETVRSKFGDAINNLDEASSAIELLNETLGVVGQAVEAELKSVGAQVVERPAPQEPAQTWA